MRVELTYFKPTGKFYTSGEYITNKSSMYEIFAEVRMKLGAGTLPGLAAGAREFIVYVEAPDHPMNFPALIIP